MEIRSRWGKTRNAYEILVKTRKGRNELEDGDKNGKICTNTNILGLSWAGSFGLKILRGSL